MFTLRNLVVLALVLSVSFAAVGDQCKSYKCADIAANKVAAKEGETKRYECSNPLVASSAVQLEFEVCPPGAYYCNATTASLEGAMCDAIIADRLAGDQCDFAGQCMTAKCTDNVCEGKKKGESCNDSENMCGPRLFCGPNAMCEDVVLLGMDCSGKHFGCEFFTRCVSKSDKQTCV
jgi:hypothetical protein